MTRSLARDLIRAGVFDTERAAEYLETLAGLGLGGDGFERRLFAELPALCDPDVALRHLSQLATHLHDAGLGFGQYLGVPAVGATGAGNVAKGGRNGRAGAGRPSGSENGDGAGDGGRCFTRLLKVLGASDELGRLMLSRPDLTLAVTGDMYDSHLWNAAQRRESMLAAVHADPGADNPVSTLTLEEGATQVRRNYRLQLAAIMAHDMEADDPLTVQPHVSAALADLAAAALEGALAVARNAVPDAEQCRFAVIGMGKLGGRELNYVSDVDLIYVVEPAAGAELEGQRLIRVGTRIGVTMQKICMSVIVGVNEPILWQIDGGLRPEGKDGPLVRTLESHRGYYEKWAKNWEFQALLKARPVAGDPALGKAYHDMTWPMVWKASKRDNFVYDCQQMRRRVESLIPLPLKDREIKLGRGGLRDVEFTVQMLQLVHGRTDESIRTPTTLEGLAELRDGGYVSRRHAAKLAQAYRFERVMEHRAQMWALKRTHLFPDLGSAAANEGGIESPRSLKGVNLDDNPELRRMARAFGLLPDELVRRYDETRREVRQLHLEIYYRPMLPQIAQLDEDDISLSPQAAEQRFASIGFADPRNAIRHVEALTQGVSRASKINRLLLPAVLAWLGEGQDPDMGLLGWRKLEEAFGTESKYLGFLRDSTSAAQRLCHVLANSRYLGDALSKSVESITWLGDDDLLRPRTRASLDTRCDSALRRYAGQQAEFATSIRAMRRHEIERIGLGWMSGVNDEAQCLASMTDVYDAAIDAALRWAMADQTRTLGLDEPPATICLIGMGRYGGREVNFSSDADVMAIYRPTHDTHGADDADGADGAAAAHAAGEGTDPFAFAKAVIETMRRILGTPITVEPKIDLDFDLRPEGKNGPMVRSLESYAEYYANWASTWESQALLRARFAAGDAALAQDFLHDVADPLRYRPEPPTETELGEIRRLKARMEAERLPRGVRRDRHLKLGKGGLSDVEWTIQLNQLRHAAEHDELRVTSTLGALAALERLGYVDSADAATLRDTWVLATAARNASYLWSGRVQQADVLPDDTYSLGGIAVCMGGRAHAHQGQEFENHLLAVMRRCRGVVERLFYGREDGREMAE